MCEAVGATLSCVLIGSFSGSRNVMFCSRESVTAPGDSCASTKYFKSRTGSGKIKQREVQRICFTVINSERPDLLRESEQAGGVGSPSVSD